MKYLGMQYLHWNSFLHLNVRRWDYLEEFKICRKE